MKEHLCIINPKVNLILDRTHPCCTFTYYVETLKKHMYYYLNLILELI